MPRQERAGRFFLKQRGEIFYICWYDRAARQTAGVSTGTGDLDKARTLLLEHAVKADQPAVSTDAQLAAVLQAYFIHYGQHLPSAHVQQAAMAAALEVWGDIDVSALDRRRQLEFVAALRERELSDWTIQSRLTRVWAALHWYQREHVRLVVPPQITAADWKPLLENRERVFSVEELASLFNASARHEHWRRFMVLAVATASRVTALLELTWDQVDDGRIRLNPEGRRQTKKRRATVPVCPTLAAELASWTREGAYVINIGGRALATQEFFDNLADAAAVAGSPNVIRHTVRTWLARRGVADIEADTFMGHKDQGSATGARYKHWQPEYLTGVTTALEALFGALAPLVARPFAGASAIEDQPLPESLDIVKPIALRVINA